MAQMLTVHRAIMNSSHQNRGGSHISQGMDSPSGIPSKNQRIPGSSCGTIQSAT